MTICTVVRSIRILIWRVTVPISLKKTGYLVSGNAVVVGSGATILIKEISSGTVSGASSVVTKSVLEKGVCADNPAKLMRMLKFLLCKLSVQAYFALAPLRSAARSKCSKSNKNG